MRILNKTSTWLEKLLAKKYVIPLVIIFVSALVFMEKGPFASSKLEELSGGTGFLDMQFGYSQTHVYDMLDRVGAAGRELYMGFLTLDFVFIVVFMFLLALLLTFLLEKAAVNSRMKILNLLPVIRSGMDAIENCLLLLVIFNYPVKLPIIVAISSMATILKWVSLVAILALIVILMIRIAWKAILPQKTIG